jgi:hypothetical protein
MESAESLEQNLASHPGRTRSTCPRSIKGLPQSVEDDHDLALAL